MTDSPKQKESFLNNVEVNQRPFSKRALAACIGLMGAMSAAQAVEVVPLIDTSPASASLLVNSLLSSSPRLSVVAGSAQYSGQASASGTFSAGGTGPSGIGINSGVVLTTGDARSIGSSAAFAGDSPNKSGDFSSGIGNAYAENTSAGSSLFSSLTSFGTTNASVLSFQFVPQDSILKLQFVFGSEDYNDLVNSGFPTDVFAVFVNGINYAVVPGTNIAISASSVNCGGPTSGPANNAGAQNCSLYRDNAPFTDLIASELDGFTVPIDLSIPVNLGAVNAISIGIADNLDSSGDSAVMLGAGTIAAVSPVPEPSSLALMFGGLCSIGLLARRRRSS